MIDALKVLIAGIAIVYLVLLVMAWFCAIISILANGVDSFERKRDKVTAELICATPVGLIIVVSVVVAGRSFVLGV